MKMKIAKKPQHKFAYPTHATRQIHLASFTSGIFAFRVAQNGVRVFENQGTCRHATILIALYAALV